MIAPIVPAWSDSGRSVAGPPDEPGFDHTKRIKVRIGSAIAQKIMIIFITDRHLLCPTFKQADTPAAAPVAQQT
eukprot:CAMPEP_0117513796 /NCGR_PEP_ID=MMETSP0784-20121206/29740_1 /TAXON_ID=39447 /ORGANISM="" /LENGTH=73 /DNA_ID=CAMNT_0005309575 /DNA_START=430 /DNA_END=651 /DNA_ORIENTATION=+